MERNPFFNIVVVSLNAKELISATINSVLSQICCDYEIVVKDGLSTDGTLEQIPKCEKIRIYSEPDTGIYDAMNQATKYLNGRYVLYLNCGDTFASDDVLKRTKGILENNDYALAYGDFLRNGVLRVAPKKMTGFASYRNALCHQAVFFRKDTLEKIPTYNTTYKVLADYDLELRIIRSYKSTISLGFPVCNYLCGGFSETPKGWALNKAERKTVIKSNFSLCERAYYAFLWHATLPGLREKILCGTNKRIKSAYLKFANRLKR